MLHIFKKVADISINTIIITDYDGNITYVNDAFTETTGYTFEEVQGKNPRIIKGGHLTEDYYKEMWDALKSGEEWSGEFLNKDKFGDEYWTFSRIAPVLDVDGSIYFIAVQQDITKIRDLEDKLVMLSSKAEQICQ
jgi:hypothetical protein